MLTYHLVRTLRNSCHRLKRWKDHPLFIEFENLFHRDSTVWPWIQKLGGRDYLTTEFLHPKLKIYQGHEIAQFNNRCLACYWLPGAKSAAQGRVANGSYSIKIKQLSNCKCINLIVDKNEVAIGCKISHQQALKFLYANLLNYHLILSEIDMLIQYWRSRQD